MNDKRVPDRRPKKGDLYIATDNCVFKGTIYIFKGIRRIIHTWPSGRKTIDENVKLEVLVSGKGTAVGQKQEYCIAQVIGSEEVCGFCMLKRLVATTDNIQASLL